MGPAVPRRVAGGGRLTDARLLNIGRLVDQKGQHILVEAASILRDQGRDFEVVIIGGGPFREALEGRIRELDLGDRVKLAGGKTGDEVRRELLGCRGLVLPSFGEGLPVVIREALALHRPVISTYGLSDGQRDPAGRRSLRQRLAAGLGGEGQGAESDEEDAAHRQAGQALGH